MNLIKLETIIESEIGNSLHSNTSKWQFIRGTLLTAMCFNVITPKQYDYLYFAYHTLLF